MICVFAPLRTRLRRPVCSSLHIYSFRLSHVDLVTVTDELKHEHLVPERPVPFTPHPFPL